MKINMLTLLVLVAVAGGYFTLVLFRGTAHHPTRAKHAAAVERPPPAAVTLPPPPPTPAVQTAMRNRLRLIAPMIRLPTKSQRKNLSEEDSRMLLKYELLGLAVLYVVWTIYKAVKGWIDRRKEFDILLDECRAEWRRRDPPWVSLDPDNEK